ncbi:MAG: squalene synthase HpnC [Pirellulales bacterium]
MPDAQFTADLDRYGPQAAPFSGDVDAAYAYCRSLARRHYENFAVTGFLIPRTLRKHFHAVYAYCRWSDDLADEVESPERATELLAWWGNMLERCVAERPTHPVFLALAETIRTFEIPLQPFRDLLTAFRQDQTRKRYETINELREYCRGSADPVGRIVLHLFQAYDERNAALSDLVCTGLQWVNFCQDVRRDLEDRDRIYLPREAWNSHAVHDEAEFRAAHASPALCALVLAETERAEVWLREGLALIPRLPRALGRTIDSDRRRRLGRLRGDSTRRRRRADGATEVEQTDQALRWLRASGCVGCSGWNVDTERGVWKEPKCANRSPTPW